METRRTWFKNGCPKCGKITIPSKHERERGWCSSCEVASWSAEKKKAVGNVLGAAFGGKGDVMDAVDKVVELNKAGGRP